MLQVISSVGCINNLLSMVTPAHIVPQNHVLPVLLSLLSPRFSEKGISTCVFFARAELLSLVSIRVVKSELPERGSCKPGFHSSLISESVTEYSNHYTVPVLVWFLVPTPTPGF